MLTRSARRARNAGTGRSFAAPTPVPFAAPTPVPFAAPPPLPFGPTPKRQLSFSTLLGREERELVAFDALGFTAPAEQPAASSTVRSSFTSKADNGFSYGYTERWPSPKKFRSPGEVLAESDARVYEQCTCDSLDTDTCTPSCQIRHHHDGGLDLLDDDLEDELDGGEGDYDDEDGDFKDGFDDGTRMSATSPGYLFCALLSVLMMAALVGFPLLSWIIVRTEPMVAVQNATITPMVAVQKATIENIKVNIGEVEITKEATQPAALSGVTTADLIELKETTLKELTADILRKEEVLLARISSPQLELADLKLSLKKDLTASLLSQAREEMAAARSKLAQEISQAKEASKRDALSSSQESQNQSQSQTETRKISDAEIERVTRAVLAAVNAEADKRAELLSARLASEAAAHVVTVRAKLETLVPAVTHTVTQAVVTQATEEVYRIAATVAEQTAQDTATAFLATSSSVSASSTLAPTSPSSSSSAVDATAALLQGPLFTEPLLKLKTEILAQIEDSKRTQDKAVDIFSNTVNALKKELAALREESMSRLTGMQTDVDTAMSQAASASATSLNTTAALLEARTVASAQAQALAQAQLETSARAEALPQAQAQSTGRQDSPAASGLDIEGAVSRVQRAVLLEVQQELAVWEAAQVEKDDEVRAAALERATSAIEPSINASAAAGVANNDNNGDYNTVEAASPAALASAAEKQLTEDIVQPSSKIGQALATSVEAHVQQHLQQHLGLYGQDAVYYMENNATEDIANSVQQITLRTQEMYVTCAAATEAAGIASGQAEAAWLIATEAAHASNATNNAVSSALAAAEKATRDHMLVQHALEEARFAANSMALDLATLKQEQEEQEREQKQREKEQDSQQEFEPVKVDCVPRPEVSKMIQGALERYSADKTEMVDYALLGDVEQSSPTHQPVATTSAGSNFLSLFAYSSTSCCKLPTAMLEPDMTPGECWPMGGSKGWALVNLTQSITVSHISLEHISRSIALDNTTVPKRFRVWGVDMMDELMTQEDSSVSAREGPGTELLVTGEYDRAGLQVQTFPVNPDVSGKPYRAVKLEIQSNYGGDWTCLYRFRVHGKP